MTHYATPSFWAAYNKLPSAIRALADQNFERLKADPTHPSLHFKAVGRFWSARIGLRYRAIAARKDEDVIWFWIGSHADYDRLIG